MDGRKNRRNSKPQKTKRGQAKSVFLSIIILMFVGIYSAFIMSQTELLGAVEKKIADTRERIDEQAAIAKRLEQERMFCESDEYYEKIARDKLGLVRKDEVIFRQTR